MSDPALVSAMGLHALVYCERLFYFEQVERIQVADERVFAGRTLHTSLQETGDFVSFSYESDTLGLKGKLDALRQRNGTLLPYEHKRGRSRGGEAWDTDVVQLTAYAMLLEEAKGVVVMEGRIRYHADNTLVHVTFSEQARREVRVALQRARTLLTTVERPPVAVDERKCTRCSLAPVCLPEESRRIQAHRQTIRLFPSDDTRQTLHVTEHGARVGKRGHELRVSLPDGESTTVPIRTVRSVACHGYVSVSAQALTLCADHGISVSWFGPGGRYRGTFCRDEDAVQRRIRQYEALRSPGACLLLARRLVRARLESQLRFLLRASRGKPRLRESIAAQLDELRDTFPGVAGAERLPTLLGYEGRGAASYMKALPNLVREPAFVPSGRSRRPPRDPTNALLSFGYAQLLREVVRAIRIVGLEVAFGFYHQPRGTAPALALDVIELFRVPCVDMAVVGAINRRQFDVDRDFRRAGEGVWLSAEGRKRAIGLFEARLQEQWRHPVLDYSLSYRRHIELEVRLLEKEWSGEPGLFARSRPR